MKKLFICMFIWSSIMTNAQDYVMMSRTRPIIDVEINGHKAAMLIDTGSELTLLSKSILGVINAEKHITKTSAIGVDGTINIWEVEDCSLSVKGVNVTSIQATNLDATCESIEARTGIRVVGILGTPAIKELGMIIDLSRGIVTIKKKSETLVSTD